MERRLASGTGDARKIKSAAAALAETPADRVGPRRRRRAGRAAGRHRRAGRRQRRRGTARSATSTAPRRPRARRRWPPRPRTSPRTRRSGSPPATGCARSSTSGAPSRGWTARPTTRCGSGIRRPARRSTAAAARTSPSSTASASAPGRPRRRCASAPRQLADSTDWGADRRATFRDLLTRVEGRRAAPPRTSTTRCGSGSRPPRTRSSRPATRSTPSATPSSTRTPPPRRRCSPRPRPSTLSDADAARAALRAIGDKWDAIGKVPRERAPELERRMRPSRRRSATPRRPAAPTRRRRPGPTSSGPAPSSTSSRPRRPRRRGAPRTPSRPGPTPTQWREWAEAAVAGARQEALGASRGAAGSPVSVGPSSRSSSRPLRWRSAATPAALLLGGQLHRGARPHHARPVERQQDHRDPRDDQPDARARDAARRPSAATTPPACPIGHATAEPASAIQASPQRRVSSARIEKPTPNTSDQPDEHPRRQRDRLADRGVVADQHVEAPGAAGVRQHERQQDARTPGSRPPKPLRPGRSRAPRAVRRLRCRP